MNAKTYNRPDTLWHRTADRILDRSEEILARAYEEAALITLDPVTGCLANGRPDALFEWYDGGDPGPDLAKLPPMPALTGQLTTAEEKENEDQIEEKSCGKEAQEVSMLDAFEEPTSHEAEETVALAEKLNHKTSAAASIGLNAESDLHAVAEPDSGTPPKASIEFPERMDKKKKGGKRKEARASQSKPTLDNGVTRNTNVANDLDKDAILLEDEQLAKALHEQELKESPRYSRRAALSSPPKTAPAHSTLPRPLAEKETASCTEEPPPDFNKARRASLRNIGITSVLQSEPPLVDRLSKRRPSSTSEMESSLSPDPRLRRIMQDSKARRASVSSAPLGYAAIYFAADEMTVMDERTDSSRRASSRIHTAISGKTVLGRYPIIQDREFELPKELKATLRHKK
ncbi:hypothetical protein BC830DRAFT_13524 [Chytriomyces sp. MP71]|nr:hypothetical protein BC830DRAFT_13524 [Chytriomyces sp. MP71]